MNNLNQDEMMEYVQSVLEKKGRKTFEIARKTVLEEEIESEKVSDALKYFMNEYWHDFHRPGMLSIVCETVGGSPKITQPIAIALSLISGAIDIHDDIIDESKRKGSRTTVFGKFGKNISILAGDVLLFKGFTLLHEAVKRGIPIEKMIIIMNIIKKTFFELGDAVSIELQFREKINVSSQEYLKMVKKKAATVEAQTRISSILGNASKKEIDVLSKYGRLLGMVDILNHDIRDMFDFEEFIHRIKYEHIPLQVIYALEISNYNNEIMLILNKKKKTRSDIKKIFEFTIKAEGPVYVAEKMNSLANDAIEQLNYIKTDTKILKILMKAFIPEIIENGEKIRTSPKEF